MVSIKDCDSIEFSIQRTEENGGSIELDNPEQLKELYLAKVRRRKYLMNNN